VERLCSDGNTNEWDEQMRSPKCNAVRCENGPLSGDVCVLSHFTSFEVPVQNVAWGHAPDHGYAGGAALDSTRRTRSPATVGLGIVVSRAPTSSLDCSCELSGAGSAVLHHRSSC